LLEVRRTEGDSIVNIGIIGAGNVGTGLAKRLIARGHAVMLSFSLDMDKLNASAAELGARAGTVAEAVQFADVVVLATPWTVTPDALGQTGSVRGRKIVWDCTNALKSDLSGLAIGTTTSGAEEIAKLAPWATVVKAIPPFAQMLHSPSMLIGEHRAGVFVCGDDADARAIVAGLVNEIEAQPVDAGPLALARYAEPAAMLLVQLAYQQGFGARIGLALLHEPPGSAPQGARV
jgi:predicted dinucleotide-binding enzyme